MITLKIGASKHALDWYGRADEYGDQTTEVAHSARSVTFEMTEEALQDLIGDAIYYAAEMGPDNTGDLDYRPAARACLRALKRAGVVWETHSYRTTITKVPA